MSSTDHPVRMITRALGVTRDLAGAEYSRPLPTSATSAACSLLDPALTAEIHARRVAVLQAAIADGSLLARPEVQRG